MLGVFIDKLIR
jgi:hypothetical protein